jgi:hypothetical protein
MIRFQAGRIHNHHGLAVAAIRGSERQSTLEFPECPGNFSELAVHAKPDLRGSFPYLVQVAVLGSSQHVADEGFLNHTILERRTEFLIGSHGRHGSRQYQHGQ